MQVRRVVTGHDAVGRAIVTIDDLVEGTPIRRGTNAAVIWTSEGFPIDNDSNGDTRQRASSTTLPNGTVFRVIEFEPGNAQRIHRTNSLDYACILSGEIDMELEQGDLVRLSAGDVIVQRGTVHNWINRGTAPCVIAFVLMAAAPVSIEGKVLAAQG
jgi:quercetin dioxygenase-like cupin family protein